MVLTLLAAGCGGGETAPITATSVPPASTATVTTTTAQATVPTGFPEVEIVVGGETWRVALAESPELRSRGLMGVTDLGGLRGMLFAWEADVESGFWMKDTLIPLDIAFFTAEGALVDLLSMVPCDADPCPSYRPAGPYRRALEVPRGGFDHLGTIDLAVP